MAFTNYLLMSLVIVILVISDVRSKEEKPVVHLDTPEVIRAYKGQNIELRCFASTSNVNKTEFSWILPEVEEYIKEDRDKRIKTEIYNFSDYKNIKVVKLKIPTIRYQDRGEYFCMGNSSVHDHKTGNVSYYKDKNKTLVVVEEQSGFTPAIWILVGFLLMTCVSVGVIFVWEWRGIAKAKKEEDAPINTVQF